MPGDFKALESQISQQLAAIQDDEEAADRQWKGITDAIVKLQAEGSHLPIIKDVITRAAVARARSASHSSVYHLLEFAFALLAAAPPPQETF